MPTTATTPQRTARNTIPTRVLALAVVGAVVALAAGCASGTGGVDANAGYAAPKTAPGSAAPGRQNALNEALPPTLTGQCPTSAADPAIAKLRADTTQVPLPAGFDAVAVVECKTVAQTVPGDGEWQFADAQRADSGLAALLAALRLPSQPPPSGTYACTAIGMVQPYFGLVDANGNVIRPRLPQTACGLPQIKALDALSALSWRTEAQQRLNQTQNQQEVVSGCYPQYKDVFELSQPTSALPWSKTSHQANTLPAMACIYAAGYMPRSPGSTTESSAVVGDDFIRGTRLDSVQESALVHELSLVGDSPAPKCSQTATRFAVLFVTDAAGVGVELDGCQRVLWPDGYLSPAPASLIQTISALGVG